MKVTCVRNLNRPGAIQFDMCVTIREEEFPCLYGALSSARKGKARAPLLKRFANDALRMRGGSCIPSGGWL